MKPRRGDQPRLFPPDDQVPAQVPAASERMASNTSKGHGRVEKRTIRLTTILTKQQQWSGLQQGFELTRERTQHGKTTVEVVHGITSLSCQRADAKRMLDLTRDHWAIENGLHHRRDVTMGEDASRVRKGTAPQVMAALRNSVIQLLSDLPTSLAAGLRTMNNCLSQALNLLGLLQRE